MIDPSTCPAPDPSKIVQLTITTVYRRYNNESQHLSSVDLLVRQGDISKVADILRLIPECRALDVNAVTTDYELWPELKTPDAIVEAT